MSDKPLISEAEIQAWADGRLAASRRAEVETWFAAHPDEAERAAAYRGLNEQLRLHYDAVLDEPVPLRLESAARRGSRLRALGVAAGWVVLGVAVGAVAGWQLHSVRAPIPVAKPQAQRPRGARALFIRCGIVSGAVRSYLVAWLPAPRRQSPLIDGEGMALVGGRLLPGEPGPVAQFMYQCARGRRVTLYVRTEGPDQRETAFRFAREGNVRVFYWIDRKFGYALSSADLEREELLRLANLVYRQLNP
jgi:anti-sigma factor RsiW